MSNRTPYCTVMVSGGFDPIHVGHIRLIRKAAEFGDVIVAANSDEWLYKRKGFNSMGFNERREILMAIKGVVDVIEVDDRDGTVCSALRKYHPTYFANGGPRTKYNTPETTICEQLNIKLLWDVGGQKINED